MRNMQNTADVGILALTIAAVDRKNFDVCNRNKI